MEYHLSQAAASWKDNCFAFLIYSRLKDFNINLRSCHLKKFEKEELIMKMKQRIQVLS